MTTNREIKVMQFSTPALTLKGWDLEVLDVEDYDKPRAIALFEALGADREGEEYNLALHSDGRWGLFGRLVEGHPFAVEIDPSKSAKQIIALVATATFGIKAGESELLAEVATWAEAQDTDLALAYLDAVKGLRGAHFEMMKAAADLECDARDIAQGKRPYGAHFDIAEKASKVSRLGEKVDERRRLVDVLGELLTGNSRL